MTLIDFAEAAGSLENGEAAPAEEVANKLPEGIERAVLWLGIARARTEQSDVVKASEAINAALATTRKLYEARRPFLLLTAAGLLARFDPVLAQAILSEAIREFNSQKPELPPRVDWQQEVSAGRLWRHFPLKVKGIEYSFEEALPPLLAADYQGTAASVLALKGEDQLAQAMLALTAALLK